MINRLAKRLEELRTAKGLNRIQLSAELGFPRLTIEKFETGVLTPSKAQLEKIAAYFSVTTGYLTGAEDESVPMAIWPKFKPENDEPVPVKKPSRPAPVQVPPGEGTNVLASLLQGDAFRKAVLEVLKSPEGQDLIRKAMKK